MNDNGIVCICGCIAAVVIAGVCTGHDGYLLLTGIGILAGLAGWQGKTEYIKFMDKSINTTPKRLGKKAN